MRLLVATGLLLTLVSCGGGREPVNHPVQTTQPAAGESWWLLEGPEYELTAGDLTPAEISQTTGSLWMLEYSVAGSARTVRLVADMAGGLFSQLSAASPQVATATVDGVEVIVREHPGRPEEGVGSSFGAEWTDNGVFVSFGGPGLSEDDLQRHLSRVRRVSRSEWEVAAAAVTQGGGDQEPSTGISPN